MAGSRSDWLSKVTPQGSILGLFIFNMLINDLLLKLQSVYDIYNYANDNTGGLSGKSAEEVCLTLKNLTQNMLPWVTEKFMEANPSKFRFTSFSITYTILR